MTDKYTQGHPQALITPSGFIFLLIVNLEVADIGPTKIAVLSNNVTHGIVVDTVFVYEVVHMDLVDLTIVNNRNSVFMT